MFPINSSERTDLSQLWMSTSAKVQWMLHKEKNSCRSWARENRCSFRALTVPKPKLRFILGVKRSSSQGTNQMSRRESKRSRVSLQYSCWMQRSLYRRQVTIATIRLKSRRWRSRESSVLGDLQLGELKSQSKSLPMSLGSNLCWDRFAFRTVITNRPLFLLRARKGMRSVFQMKLKGPSENRKKLIGTWITN